jgi:hypothetical protein
LCRRPVSFRDSATNAGCHHVRVVDVDHGSRRTISRFER